MNETAIVKFLAEQIKLEGEMKGDNFVALEEMPPGIAPRKMPWTFDPMNEIRHAWMIVEWLHRQGNWIVELSLDGNWDCVVLNYPDVGRAESEKAPKAICIAATRALATDAQCKEWGV